MHSVTMDAQCQYLVDSFSDLRSPTSIKVYRISIVDSTPRPQLLFVLHDASAEEASFAKSFAPPELLTFPSSDGTAQLYGALYLPDKTQHGPGPYPLVCAVYGGPHVQRVQRSFAQCTDLRAQRLRYMGMAVLKCDNRGSARRGLAFESAIRHRLGRLEVLDQVTAVRYVKKHYPICDRNVGIYGWSYGGYLAAMCLCRAPQVFSVAVAGAPVTDWRLYDTHYTERYMGMPSDHYVKSSVLSHVPHLQSHQKIMIVHGLIDENVHFRHSSRLIQALISHDQEYDLLLFPEERHSPRRLRDRTYMERRISDFFLKHVKHAETRRNVVPVAQETATNGERLRISTRMTAAL